MMLVTIALAPKDRDDSAVPLGDGKVWNDAGSSSGEDTANYKAAFSKSGRPGHIWISGRVQAFPRKRYGPWDLLFLALYSALGDRARRLLAEIGESDPRGGDANSVVHAGMEMGQMALIRENNMLTVSGGREKTNGQ